MSRYPQPVIPLKIYRFHFNIEKPLKLPEYPGSAWRGAFGRALKQTVCVVRNTPCEQCLLKSACAYSYIFETPPPAHATKMRKYNATPHPFVLRFQTKTSEQQRYIIEIILFGHGQRYLPFIIHAIKTAGNDGIGGSRQVFDLIEIEEVAFQGQTQSIYQNGELQPQKPAISPPIPEMPPHIQIQFNSPIRIKHNQKNLTAQDFNFGAFFSTLLRRISMLTYFHTDEALETDFAELTAKAKDITLTEQQLNWYDWTRYSSRQQTEMNMGGLIGTIALDTQELTDFWPYLWLGQWTHIGKATSMGLGAYQIITTSLSN